MFRSRVAGPGSDYIEVSDFITVRENSTDGEIIITLIDDKVPETNEIFFIQLLNVTLISTAAKSRFLC